MVLRCSPGTTTVLVTAPDPSSGKYVMDTVASDAWGLDRVRNVRKSEMPVPSAKYHTFSKPGKAAVAWPSAMGTMAGSKVRLKYMARSTTTPWGASVLTTTPKPRDTGSE